jgi:trimeric autotransporter adhesin
MFRTLFVFATVSLLVISAVPADSQIPQTIALSGILNNHLGQPRPDGQYTATFRLFTSLTGGTAVWSEAGRTVTVAGGRGLFNTDLGAGTPFGALPFDQPYFLEIQVDGDPPMTPRLPLRSVPYALRAPGGTIALPFSGSTSVASPAMSIINTGAGPAIRGSGAGFHNSLGSAPAAVQGVATSETARTVGVSGVAVASAGGVGVLGQGAHSGLFGIGNLHGGYFMGTAAASYGVYAEATVAGSTGVYGQASNGFGVHGQASAGTGVLGATDSVYGVRGIATAGGIGVRGESQSSTGVSATSVSGRGVSATSTSNTAVYGESEQLHGVTGRALGTGRGVQGLGTTGPGVYGESVGESGSGNHGVHGIARVAGRAGVFGENALPGAFGVRGVASGAASTGVHGEANATSGSRGVHGVSSAGYGVYGSGATAAIAGVHGEHANGASGSLATTFAGYPAGVLGIAAGLNSAGVRGAATGSGSAGIRGIGATGSWAGYFNGDVFITGFVGAEGGKNFRIDHPLDPENKYLVHASLESNEVLNVYSGNVTTDANGEAVVELPAYFETLNKDFRYQLTVIGQRASAYVISEIENNAFRIETDKPNVKVSWQVTGVRNDRYMRENPMEVEPLKPEHERMAGRLSE